MPFYPFKCPVCGHEKIVNVPIAKRDSEMICCPRHHEGYPAVILMHRIPAVSNFFVHGLSAKNGYSR